METIHAATDLDPVTTDDGAAQAPGNVPESTAASVPPPPSQTALAVQDVIQGARAYHLWGMLGWQDVRRCYRRSVLGPFWFTISMGLLVAALGTLYGAILKVDVADYVPFLALGFIVWNLISSLITESCTSFINADKIIKEVSLPLSIHVYRVVWRNLIIFFHNTVILVPVAVIFSTWPGWNGLLALPGFVLLCLNGMWGGVLIGLLSARFRDVPPIVGSVLRIAFFVTPIIWMPELVPGRTLVMDFNPFFHFVELVRAPLLGQAPGLASWLSVLGFTCGGWLMTIALFRLYRWRIAYWV